MSTRQNLLFAIFGITGLAATLAASHRLGVRADDYRFFDELVEVKHLISTRYIEQPDAGKLREGAIKGMVEALADPYTVYVPASERGEFNKSLTGEYVGIGAQVNMQQGWLTIVSPLEDSPAFRVGLMPDDRVVEIEGQSTQNKSVEACVGMLMGEPGTPVKIVVERKGARLEFEIIRERIKTRAVKSFHRRDDDPNNWEFLIDRDRRIAYVRLTNFTPRCSQEVLEALRSVGAHEGRLGGLVLDLRGNPGGLLSEAEAIADFFLKEGVIVSTRGRAHPEKVTRAVSAGTLPDFPLAVLINGASASASEVLAGALVENNRARRRGARSFGKGSVQSVIELPSGNGAEIKLTEQGTSCPAAEASHARTTLPSGALIPAMGLCAHDRCADHRHDGRCVAGRRSCGPISPGRPTPRTGQRPIRSLKPCWTLNSPPPCAPCRPASTAARGRPRARRAAPRAASRRRNSAGSSSSSSG